jgi:NAD(P)-dependent dehydrogenase (short-subunit alcohol dehydrogenase family)
MPTTTNLLNDHVILVTGGGSGIGRATSAMLAADGAIVTIAGLNGNAAAEAASEITASGGRASGVSVDVADVDAVSGVVAGIVREHGRLDGAFNNAGIEGPTAKILDLSAQDWEQVIRVNLTGVFNCMKAENE